MFSGLLHRFNLLIEIICLKLITIAISKKVLTFLALNKFCYFVIYNKFKWVLHEETTKINVYKKIFFRSTTI